MRAPNPYDVMVHLVGMMYPAMACHALHRAKALLLHTYVPTDR
jgi:hypothetical protein